MLIYSKGFKPVLDFNHLIIQMRIDQCLSCSMQSAHPPLTPDELPSWLTWVTLFLGSPGLKEIRITITWPPWLPALSVPLWCSQPLPQQHRLIWGSSPFPQQDFSVHQRRTVARVAHSFSKFQSSRFQRIYISRFCIQQLLTLLITKNGLIFHS